ncbi:enoyl-CoA delta isomerase 1, mitochondrial-like [Adelges cooleyi]|uniref:enoyl-CoA delta isomerase 1, mitochondrial-like n=1 Tax=Adelges cooleyi TaxID=133065 RepID=UPI00217FA569|nr:enoyl-CoA delta isomerase 1, mitochondrial-like [Adelges cooleyi]XP_050422919.1 enoyl-CoA delta isomerase 1, mitochondrial-like [Adelges cooleyi]
MLGRHTLNKTLKLINRRYASQSMLSSTTDEKTGIATVALNKPPVNSLNLEFLNEFKTQIHQLQNDKARGMILTSSLQNVFCAGLDITEFYKPDLSRLAEFWTTVQETWLALYLTPFPTAAVINGHSPAGGCLLALSCDYRIMVGPKYTIGLNETKLGIVAPKWFQDSIVAVIGQRNAELSLIAGKMYSTEEALKIGLIDESVPDASRALEQGIKFLNNFQKISPWAFKMTKDISRQPTVQWLLENKQKDLDFVLQFMQSPNVQKGLGLYLQSLKK